MKKLFVTSLVCLFFFAGTMSGTAQVISPEQESVKNEIGEVVRVIFQSLEKMDVDALFQSYSDSHGFILINTAGMMVNLQGAKFGHAEWFKSFSSMKVTTIKEEFKFLPGDFVLWAWQGKFEMTLKTGEHLTIDKFGITFVFRKIDGLWKVIYQHSSSLPPSPPTP